MKMENIGFPQVMTIMEHMPSHVFSAQSITATAAPRMMMKLFFDVAIIAKGTTVEIV